MGLTIHYTLNLESNSTSNVRQSLERLRQTALDMPFVLVSSLMEFQGEEAQFNQADPLTDCRWLKLHTSRLLVLNTGQLVKVPPEHVIGFTTLPGEGAEDAYFTLCKYPNILTQNKTQIPTHLEGWWGDGYCKTQGAADRQYGGVENFIKCHLLVISLCQAAQELGLLHQVYDESGFWDHRDIKALATAVGEWNQHVASVIKAVRHSWPGLLA